MHTINKHYLKEAEKLASIGFFSANRETGESEWSDEVYRIFGYKPREVNPTLNLIFSHIHEDEKLLTEEIFKSLQSDDTEAEITVRIKDKMKNVIWCSIKALASGNDADAPGVFFGTIQDVTQLKNSQEALVKSKAQLQTFIDTLNESALIIEPDSTVQMANKTAAQRLGTTVARLTGSKLSEFLPPDVMNFRLQQIQYVLDSKSGHHFEDVRLNRHMVSQFSPFINNGEIESIAVLGVDITEQKEREHELLKLNSIIEKSSASIIITDSSGTIEYANPSFFALTGYTKEETIGSNPRILKSDIHDETFYEELWETLLSGNTWKGELCNRKKNGNLYWESVSIAPVKNNSGTITNFIATKDDITERKELEKLKDDIELIVRHDLKTPLSSIIGLPELLESNENLTDEQKDIIDMIKISGKRMLNMINMSLDLYKMETGDYCYTPKEIDLADILQGVLKDLSNSLTRMHISLIWLINGKKSEKPDPYYIQSDETLLYSMLANLLNNAVEASPINGTIEVSIDTGDKTVLVISNSGTVPEDIRKTFFNKFKTKGKSRGTGLGTYSAMLAAKTMGYGLTMETSSEKNKTSLSIIIP